MKALYYALIVAFPIILFSGCGKKELKLAENGKTNYSIVIEPDADSVILKSAGELADYFKSVTKAELEIKRSIPEKGKYISIEKDTIALKEYINIKAGNGNLSIKGGTDRYPLFATYFDEAENAVKDNVVLLDRVRKQRQTIEYAILEISISFSDNPVIAAISYTVMSFFSLISRMIFS